jgi:hypothetical protein
MKWPLLAVALLLSTRSVQAQHRDDPATGHGYLAVCSREEQDWRMACNFYSAGMNNMLLTIDMQADSDWSAPLGTRRLLISNAFFSRF